MIVTAGTIVRVGLLLLVAIVTQISGFSGIRIFGGTFDLMPLVVAAIALYGGSVTGSVVGFACGMLVDLALGHTLGASSLVLTAVGYSTGRSRRLTMPNTSSASQALSTTVTSASRSTSALTLESIWSMKLTAPRAAT